MMLLDATGLLFSYLSIHLLLLPTGAPSEIVRSSVELSRQLFCDLDLFFGVFFFF